MSSLLMCDSVRLGEVREVMACQLGPPIPFQSTWAVICAADRPSATLKGVPESASSRRGRTFSMPSSQVHSRFKLMKVGATTDSSLVTAILRLRFMLVSGRSWHLCADSGEAESELPTPPQRSGRCLPGAGLWAAGQATPAVTRISDRGSLAMLHLLCERGREPFEAMLALDTPDRCRSVGSWREEPDLLAAGIVGLHGTRSRFWSGGMLLTRR